MSSIVRGSALYGFDSFATEQGLHPERMLQEAGLPADALQRPDSLIDYTQFITLLERCAARTGNPLFGLGFGLHQGVHIFGNLIYVVQNAGTVGDALLALKKYFHTYNQGSDIQLEIQGNSARLAYEVTIGDAASIRQDAELAMGVGQRLMQSLLGHRWRPSALLVRHSPIATASDYRRLLGITPRFDSAHNAWVFDAALLDVPLRAADARLQQIIEQQVEELSQITLQELPAMVQRLLRDMLPHGKTSIEQVAERLMISPRTLQRYLQEANTGFQELLDQTRQTLSTRYLCDSSISMTQVAEMLGYADLSTFSRAFSRWNGISPRKWKQRYQQNRLANVDVMPSPKPAHAPAQASAA